MHMLVCPNGYVGVMFDHLIVVFDYGWMQDHVYQGRVMIGKAKWPSHGMVSVILKMGQVTWKWRNQAKNIKSIPLDDVSRPSGLD